VQVAVPAGATPGTLVEIDGQGDLVDTRVRVLRVVIVDGGERAEEIRAARADFEWKLRSAWEFAREARRRRRRRVRFAAIAAAAALACVPVARWLAKAKAGEPCTTEEDCRSGACMRLLRAADARLHTEGQLCTASCTTDLDCPEAMVCREADAEEGSLTVTGAPAGPACIPRGYVRLRAVTPPRSR
jgi:hypothetical protein